MKKIFLSLLLAASTATMFATGELSGKFTVNFNGDQVQFSKGNLQFNASVGQHLVDIAKPQPGTFRFAERQYDFIGDATLGNVNEAETKCNNQLIANQTTKAGLIYSPLSVETILLTP